MDALRQVGVNLEEYGANQFILREHPIWMKEEEIESGIYEMCDMLLLPNRGVNQAVSGNTGHHDVW